MRNAIRTMLTLALVLGLVVPAAASEIAVGANGQVIQLLNGQYGELFPKGNDADPAASVLAIDFIGGDSARRSLVPSTSGLSPELSPTLYHDPTVDVTYVLWSQRHNGVHPILRLTQYSNEEWSETLDITGSVFAAKNDPQLSVHHESWTDTNGDRVERTVFHVLWWEEFGSVIEQRVSALVLENGSLVGSTGILTLSDFVAQDPEDLDSPGPGSATVRLLRSEDGVVVGFFGPEGKIDVLSSQVLPASLSRLALRVEETILGHDSSGETTLEQEVVDAMLAFDSEFHPATLMVMIESVLELISSTEDPGSWLGTALEALADKAMPHMVEIGIKMAPGGSDVQDVSVVTVRSESETAVSGAHHLAMTKVASFEVPDEPVSSNAQLFISPRGTAALLAWDVGDYVVYRETTLDGWSNVSHLDVTKGIDRETAYRILEERTLER